MHGPILFWAGLVLVVFSPKLRPLLRRSVMRSRSFSLPLLVVTAVAAVALAASCSTDKAAGPKACCDQPKTPPGVPAFTVVKDDASGPSDGQTRQDPRRAQAEDQA